VTSDRPRTGARTVTLVTGGRATRVHWPAGPAGVAAFAAALSAAT